MVMGPFSSTFLAVSSLLESSSDLMSSRPTGAMPVLSWMILVMKLGA